jgi:hypothetical protein
MSATYVRHNLIETSQEVRIPQVGVMVRVVRASLQGEVLDIEYHWPPILVPSNVEIS